jgi:alginate O-acetyltransferase complex protein AlgI
MPLNSYEFILAFLPITVAGFLFFARSARSDAVISWLVAASITFYAFASLSTLAVILPSILLDYFFALVLLGYPSRQGLRKLVFAAGVALNILVLGYFKYRNFFLDTANTLFATHYELTQLILPIGLSFITFQKIAFLADVHSGQVQSVRLLDFLLFTLFFPRAIAGPIVRYQEIVPQFAYATPSRNFTVDMTVGGCLFAVGLFKKAVIADGVAPFASLAFDPPPEFNQPLTLLTAWVSVLAYTFQLYFDFSGYSDMALGAARVFGVKLPMNFNSPLKSSSIVEFWNRWHITLTRFLTAYIYTPIVLRMSRARMAQGKPILRGKHSSVSAIASLVCLPTLVTMTISGLWHGAGWQFIVWGLLHGIYLSVNQAWRILRPRFWTDRASYGHAMKPIGFVLTFGSVVTALVFFRARSVSSALSVLGAMFGTNGILPHDAQVLLRLGIPLPWYFLMILMPLSPFVWVAALSLGATVFPNTLELLRRFQPALDFPSEEPIQIGARQAELPDLAKGSSNWGRTPAGGRIHAVWIGVRRLQHLGLSLNRVTATIVALLSSLGIAALSRGGAFIYGQF